MDFICGTGTGGVAGSYETWRALFHQVKWRDVWNTSVDQIGTYGVGCQLYFEFLRALIVVFVTMAILATPLMYVCCHGTMVGGLSKVV